MRTSILLAVKHDGSRELLCFAETQKDFTETLARWKKLKAQAATAGSHDQLAKVVYQESDGHQMHVRFRTPADQKKHDAARDAENRAYKKKVADSVKQAEKDERAPRLPKPDDSGPTVEEYVKQGYDPRTYPPQGFASKSTSEAIAAAIQKHDAARDAEK